MTTKDWIKTNREREMKPGKINISSSTTELVTKKEKKAKYI